jgi:hypothetical protein
MNSVWKPKKTLFNIEGYGEFFSGITPSYRSLVSFAFVLFIYSFSYRSRVSFTFAIVACNHIAKDLFSLKKILKNNGVFLVLCAYNYDYGIPTFLIFKMSVQIEES